MNSITTEEKNNWVTKIILLLFAAYVLFLVALNIYVVINESMLKYLILVLPVWLGCIFIAYRFRVSPKIFIIGILTASFILKGITVAMNNIEPVSDFKMFYDCAVALYKGNTGWSKWTYFSDWAYQTGPIAYYALLMKIFGTGLLPLKLCNCALMAGTNVLIYLIARKITNEGAARAAALLYLFYPAPYFLAPVLTNQHFAAFMFFAAIYIFMAVRMNIVVKGLLCGVITALANVLRPLGLLIFAALILWVIFQIIRTRKLVTLVLASIMLVTFMLTTWSVSAYFVSSGISPYGLSNNFPLWKFVVGLNEQTSGQYSLEDQTKIFYMEDKAQRDIVAKRVIKERLSIGFNRMLEFMVKKQEVMWASTDTLRWGYYVVKDNGLVPQDSIKHIEHRLIKSEKIYYTLAMVLMFIGIIYIIWRRKKMNSLSLYIIFLLMAFYSVHLLIEVQVRYRYFAMICVYILISYGISFFAEICAPKANKWENRPQ